MPRRRAHTRASAVCAAFAAFAALAISACRADAAEVCTVIADGASGQVLLQRGECARRVTPASTFKIAISLMGFDAAFLKDEHTPLLPFQPGYVDWRASWKQPTDPARWMRESVVWYSQQVTHALGKARFADYTRRFNYGNMDVRGDREHDGLTLSWIGASLQISPLEQVGFLTRLLNRRLGVSENAYAMTARLTAADGAPDGWNLHGKTGASSGWGWYVGWVQNDARTLVFARLVRSDDSQPKDVFTGDWARSGFLADLPRLIEQSSPP